PLIEALNHWVHCVRYWGLSATGRLVRQEQLTGDSVLPSEVRGVVAVVRHAQQPRTPAPVAVLQAPVRDAGHVADQLEVVADPFGVAEDRVAADPHGRLVPAELVL